MEYKPTRNWIPGDRDKGIESRLIAKPVEKKAPPDMEAVFHVVGEYMDSMRKKDGKYFKRTLGDDRTELIGPGAAIRISTADFEEIVQIITDHIGKQALPL